MQISNNLEGLRVLLLLQIRGPLDDLQSIHELRNHHGIATTPIRHAPTTYAHLSHPIVTPCTDLSGEPLSEPR